MNSKTCSKYKTIAIEGNVGSGKTTFLRHFQQMNGENIQQMECFGEPIDKWRDVRGYNIYQLFNDHINDWCFPFQSYVQKTMLELHQSAPKAPEVTIKLMERTLYSARFCFVENLFRRQHLKPELYAILDEWFNHFVVNEPKVGLDLIIYLRTHPEVVFERIQKRNRNEDQFLTIDYLKDVHNLHEEWLLSDGSHFAIPAPVIIIDANQGLNEVKSVYDKHSVDILNGKAFL